MPNGTTRNLHLEISELHRKADVQGLAAMAFSLATSLAVAENELSQLREAGEAKRRRDRERVALQRERRATTATSGDSRVLEQKQISVVETATTTTKATATPTTQSVFCAREALLEKVPSRQAWDAEMRMMQDGGRGRDYYASPEQMEEACRDYLANGASDQPNMKQFRAYVRRAVAGEKPATSRPSSSSGKDVEARAGHLVAQIQSLKKQNPGRGHFIAVDAVRELGDDVFAAFQAVGGSGRFLSTTGENFGFLVRDFSNALRGAA